VRAGWTICWERGFIYLVETQVNEMEDLVLGRSFDLLVVLINMYQNRNFIVLILVSMSGWCREG
jgi:hypothetical protein